jgi:hypothetical protein
MGNDFRGFRAHVFDKLDGNNLRFEWSRKAGWYKAGTRQRLFDETDLLVGGALPLFRSTLADDIEKVFRARRWDRAVVFTEYWGDHSIAGMHDPEDEMRLTLFDVVPHKDGLLAPKRFLKLFGHLPVPSYLGEVGWTRDYVSRVRDGTVPGITFEGVVGKSSDGKVMAKAKTQAWINRIKELYGERADAIINS